MFIWQLHACQVHTVYAVCVTYGLLTSLTLTFSHWSVMFVVKEEVLGYRKECLIFILSISNA